MSPALPIILRDGGRLRDPRKLPSLAAWYDASDLASMTYDGSNRVSLVADKSGNSNVNCYVHGNGSGNNAEASIAGAASSFTSLELIIDAASPNWTTGATDQDLGCLYGAGGSADSVEVAISATANAALFDYEDGAGVRYQKVVAGVFTGFANFSRKLLKFTLNAAANPHVLTVYESVDGGSSWTQLATDTQAATIGIRYSATTKTGIIAGRTASSTRNSATGTRVYSGRFNAAIGGSAIWTFDPSSTAKLAASVVSGGTTWTINTSGATGARICGERDLYQGTVANQPVLTIAAAGNYLTFDGSNDYLKAAPFSLSQPETVYFAGSQVTWTINDDIFDGNATDSGALFQSNTTPKFSAYMGGSASENSGWALATRAVISSVFFAAPARTSTRVNLGSTVGGGGGGANNMNGFTVGSNGGGSAAYGNITASEIAIYSDAHPSRAQDRFARYAMSKWRIA